MCALLKFADKPQLPHWNYACFIIDYLDKIFQEFFNKEHGRIIGERW